LFRSSALHFLLLGALLFGARSVAGVGRPEPVRSFDRTPIVVTAEEIVRIRDSYRETIGGEPDAAAYDYMIGRYIEDELLYREALSLGLDRGDDTIRWRLIEKMEYLGEAAKGDDEEVVLDRAFALGLQRDDATVRSVLIHKYSMLVRFAHDTGPIPESELRAYYENTSGRFASPERVSFSHIFFSAQNRGDKAVQDARHLLTALRAKRATALDAIALGDPFLAGRQVNHVSGRRVAAMFGESFVADMATAPVGEWSGPYESAYGLHLVLLSDRNESGRIAFESVRSQVARSAEHERRERRLKSKLAELRERYDIEIQWDDMAALAARKRP